MCVYIYILQVVGKVWGFQLMMFLGFSCACACCEILIDGQNQTKKPKNLRSSALSCQESAWTEVEFNVYLIFIIFNYPYGAELLVFVWKYWYLFVI